MSDQVFILVLVSMFFAMPFLGGWMSHRMKLSAEKAARHLNRTEELEDRVRLLERIVTDKGYDVATQIEALRDQGPVEDQLEDQREASRN